MQLIDKPIPSYSPEGEPCSPRITVLMFVALLTIGCAAVSVHAQSNPPATAAPIPAAVIVQRMVEQNRTRAQRLEYFTSVRHYHLEFHGFGRSMTADMHVKVSYISGSGKRFQVLDQSGSHLLLDHVFRKLLATEQDDSRQQRAALTPANYNFAFQEQTVENGHRVYVFAVEPRIEGKLLYRGRIWIDGNDYAVIRVEAQPAESPSFWIKKTEIHHVYAKSGEFWLPETDRSESKVRFGGSAVLTIDYGTYQFEEPLGIGREEATQVIARKPLSDAR